MNAVRKPPVVRGNHGSPDAAGGRRETDFHFDKAKEGTFPWLGFGLVAGAVGTALYFGHDANSMLGQAAAVIIGLGGIHGLWRGGFRKLVMLPVTIALMLLVSTKPDFADPAIQALNNGQSSTIGNVIACGLAIALSMFVTTAVVRRVREKVIMKRPLLRGTDRFTGTTIGAAEGALIVLGLCWSVALLEPQAREVAHHPNTVEGSFQHELATNIVRLGEEIDDSPIRSLVREHNVLAELPVVKAAMDQAGAGNGSPWDASSSEGARRLLKQIESGEYGEELSNAVKRLQNQGGNSGRSN